MRSWLGRAAFLGRAGWLGLGLAFGVAAHSEPALADAKTVEHANTAEKARAQVKFKEASAHFRAARWEEAVVGFRASHEIVQSPNTHVMLGRALRKAGRLVEAYETLQQASEDARALASRIPKYNQAAKTAEVELAELKSDVALVSVEVASTDGLALNVGGRQIPENRWKSIPVMPGQVEIVLKAPDGREVRRLIDAVASREHPITLELPEPAPAQPAGPLAARGPSVASDVPPSTSVKDDSTRGERPLRPLAFVAAGVGALGVATFAIAGSMARSTENELEASCPSNRCPPGMQDKVDEGQSQQTIANVGLAVGVIGIGTAVALFVSGGSSSTSESVRRRPKSSARLELAGSPGSLFLRGAF